MKEQNSYAYIGNSKKKVIKEGNKLIILPRVSPEDCIKGIFEEKEIQILESVRTKLVFRTEVILNKDVFDVKITINNVKHSFYVDIEVSGKTKYKIIKCLEYIHKKLEESDLNKKGDYIQVVTYDAISEYYCNKIFPNLAKFERKLRDLMLSIYLVNFEENYYEHQFDEKLKEIIKSKVKATGGKEKKAEVRIKEAFYSVDFGLINEMLFTPKVSKYEIDRISKTLSKTKDLSILSDQKLRELLTSAILPKSDWERFFADKIEGEDFKELFDRIWGKRNSVAHQKFFYEKDFSLLKKDLDTAIAAINQAIEITKDKEFSRQNTEYLRERALEVSESLSKAFAGTEEYMKKIGITLSRMAEGFVEATWPSLEVIRKSIADAASKYYLPKLNDENESSAEDDGESESDDEDIE